MLSQFACSAGWCLPPTPAPMLASTTSHNSESRILKGVHWRHSPKLIRLVALHFATKQLACARHFRHLDILVTDNIDVDPDRLASLNAGIDASFLFLLQSPDHGIEFIVRNIIRVDRAHLSPLALPASAVRAALVSTQARGLKIFQQGWLERHETHYGQHSRAFKSDLGFVLPKITIQVVSHRDYNRRFARASLWSWAQPRNVGGLEQISSRSSPMMSRLQISMKISLSYAIGRS